MSWALMLERSRPLLSGGVVAPCCVAGRFFRMSRDRRFGAFSFAFFIMGIDWLVIAVVDPRKELKPYFISGAAPVVPGDHLGHRRQEPRTQQDVWMR